MPEFLLEVSLSGIINLDNRVLKFLYISFWDFSKCFFGHPMLF